MKSLNVSKIIRYILFNGLLIIFQTRALAQYTAEYSKVIQPSPNAASLGSFGNNSKGTYNGVPEISIPLFPNIFSNQAGNIVLHYDASGTKAAQQASWVGLGWSLAYGGGVITRTVRGMDDLYSGGYHGIQDLPSATVLSNFYNSHGANDPNDYLRNYMMGVGSGQIDTEPDIFSLNIGNYNDKFVFDKAANGSSIIQLEGSNLKIVYLDPGWKITDGDGNKYYFNKQEWAESWSTTNDHEVSYGPAPNDFVDNSNVPHDIITAWYLDSIVTAKSDRIRFFYTSERTLSLMQKSEQEYTLLQTYLGCPPSIPNPYHRYTSSQQILVNAVPSSISFPNGSIEFYKAPRSDINDIYGANSASSLDYIVEKDKSGTILKKIQFYYSYFNQNDLDPINKRLKLDSVKDVSDAVHVVPAYKMTYYNSQSLPPKITKAIDHWGYYNNQTDNQTLLVEASTDQPYYKYFPGANRRPDTTLASVQNGVLSSLVYPTGGSTDYKYELNEYTTLYGNDRFDVKDTTILLGPAQANANWTGASFTLTEATDIKFEFNYWDPNHPDLRDEFISDFAFLYVGSNTLPYYTFRNAQYNSQLSYITEQTLRLGAGTYTLRLVPVNQTYYTFFSASWKKRTYLTQRKGGGLRIKQIENFDGTGKKTVKKFIYNEGGLSTGILLEPAAYDFVTDVGGVMLCPDGWSNNFGGYYFVRSSNSNYVEGFMKSGTIGYGKVTELIGENGEGGRTEYSFINDIPPYSQVPAFPGWIYPLDGRLATLKNYNSGNVLLKKVAYTYDSVPQVPLGSPASINGIKVLNFPWTTTAFYANIYNNATVFNPVTTESNVEYFGLDSVKTVKHYRYDNPLHKQVTKMEENSSSGDLLTTNYLYADDLKSSGSPSIYNAMSDNNFHNAVIEQQFYKNNVFKQAKRTNYDYWKNNAWGDNTATFFLPKSLETKQGINGYESRINYNYYDGSGNLLEQSQSNGLHIAYLWGYEKQYPIAEIKNATYESLVATLGQSMVDQLSGSNPGSDLLVRSSLNNLRMNLSNAQVMTYTYSPLVGMTSMTDAKGQTTYYDYDSFQRLKTVRDQEGKIIKTYCYNYAGQSTGCNVPVTTYSSGEHHGDFTKSDCTSGVGTTVTYSVSAGAYTSTISQADADQKAINDVNANGPSYANSHGSCSAPSTIYARIEISNQSTSLFGGNPRTTGDVYIRFYSNSACTVPYTLANSLSVNVTDNTTVTVDYGSPSSSESSSAFSVGAGNSSYYIGSKILETVVTFSSEDFGSITYDTTHSFDVATGTGYIVSPSLIN